MRSSWQMKETTGKGTYVWLKVGSVEKESRRRESAHQGRVAESGKTTPMHKGNKRNIFNSTRKRPARSAKVGGYRDVDCFDIRKISTRPRRKLRTEFR